MHLLNEDMNKNKDYEKIKLFLKIHTKSYKNVQTLWPTFHLQLKVNKAPKGFSVHIKMFHCLIFIPKGNKR